MNGIERAFTSLRLLCVRNGPLTQDQERDMSDYDRELNVRELNIDELNEVSGGEGDGTHTGGGGGNGTGGGRKHWWAGADDGNSVANIA
jgi:bacteriocin-like protein